jgi:hypothetical protein
VTFFDKEKKNPNKPSSFNCKKNKEYAKQFPQTAPQTDNANIYTQHHQRVGIASIYP